MPLESFTKIRRNINVVVHVLLACAEAVNPLNVQLHPMCHLLVLLGAHHIFHVSRLRVNLLGKYINTIKRKTPLRANTRIDALVHA
jgi:hypothetical protein